MGSKSFEVCGGNYKYFAPNGTRNRGVFIPSLSVAPLTLPLNQ